MGVVAVRERERKRECRVRGSEREGKRVEAFSSLGWPKLKGVRLSVVLGYTFPSNMPCHRSCGTMPHYQLIFIN